MAPKLWYLQDLPAVIIFLYHSLSSEAKNREQSWGYWTSKPIDDRSRHCIGNVSDIEWWIAAVVRWHCCTMTLYYDDNLKQMRWRLDFVSGSDALKMVRYHATFFLKNRLNVKQCCSFFAWALFLCFIVKLYVRLHPQDFYSSAVVMTCSWQVM